MTTAFFVKFPDGGIYATGTQGTIPGGPIAYELREDAEKIAKAIGGTVTENDLDCIIAFCLKRNYTLWIKKAFGGMAYIEETIPATEGEMVRVGGAARQRAITAGGRLSQPGSGAYNVRYGFER